MALAAVPLFTAMTETPHASPTGEPPAGCSRDALRSALDTLLEPAPPDDADPEDEGADPDADIDDD